MKNFQLEEILENENLVSDIASFKFALAFKKNKNLINEELKSIRSLADPSDEFKKVNDEMDKVKIKYCDKDEDGKPITKSGEHGQQFISITPENKKKLLSELKKIEDANKELFSGQELKNKLFVDAMNAECDIEFKIVYASELPKTITLKQLDIIDFMINLDK